MFCSTGSSASISDSRYEMAITLPTHFIAEIYTNYHASITIVLYYTSIDTLHLYT